MSIKDIVADYLKENGYGGLHSDHECGCFDNDLMPCGECTGDCEPAYRIPAHCSTCEVGCDGRDEGNVWCLTSEEPTQEIKEAVANMLTTGKAVPCPKCGSNNIKCRGSIWNCEDCGERW